jgi:GPH family glycoside/pentoside/hexuronide:cation symporter
MGFKIGTGLTSFVVSALLSAAGYVSSSSGGHVQSAQALGMVRNLFIYGIILVWLVAVVVLILYKLDQKMPAIAEELKEREERGSM